MIQRNLKKIDDVKELSCSGCERTWGCTENVNGIEYYWDCNICRVKIRKKDCALNGVVADIMIKRCPECRKTDGD